MFGYTQAIVVLQGSRVAVCILMLRHESLPAAQSFNMLPKMEDVK